MKPKQAPAAEAPHESGELHRRVNGIMEAGLLDHLPRGGWRVFLQCRQWADFKKCRFTVSVRTLAKCCRMSKSAAQRGLQHVIEAGVISEHKPATVQYRTFEIVIPKTTPSAGRQRDDRNKGKNTKPWKTEEAERSDTEEEKPWD